MTEKKATVTAGDVERLIELARGQLRRNVDPTQTHQRLVEGIRALTAENERLKVYLRKYHDALAAGATKTAVAELLKKKP